MEASTLTAMLLAVPALALGGLAGAWFASRSAKRRLDEVQTLATAQAEAARAGLEEKIRGLEAQLADLRSQHAQALETARELGQADGDKAVRIGELQTQLTAAARAQAENEARLKALVEDTEKRFTAAFEALAGRILEEKTTKFTETNHSRLKELLEPFRERLKDFQKKVEDTHLTDVTERRSLKDELTRLMALNQQVSQDAKNLTTALKGEAKTQGSWGEFILERALEDSGLVKGREYEVQDSRLNEAGERQQPDVVIRLPEDRRIVVDSKVSLVGFERYASADNDADRAAALDSHLLSVRTHISTLSKKNYPALYGFESLDFTLLFIPIEPAFLVAVQADPDLYAMAWKKNIVLVSPTTLLATLRVVESVWRIERQNRNVMKIAEQAGKMHDAFVAFVVELDKVSRNLQTAGTSLDDAIKKLHTGRGNLVKRAIDIRKLGAKTSKELPAALVELTDDADDDLAGLPDAGPDDAPDNLPDA
ncbi:MAG: DNA recombination protein RmuC [Gammaproteobacteria bacterium]